MRKIPVVTLRTPQQYYPDLIHGKNPADLALIKNLFQSASVLAIHQR